MQTDGSQVSHDKNEAHHKKKKKENTMKKVNFEKLKEKETRAKYAFSVEMMMMDRSIIQNI